MPALGGLRQIRIPIKAVRAEVRPVSSPRPSWSTKNRFNSLLQINPFDKLNLHPIMVLHKVTATCPGQATDTSTLTLMKSSISAVTLGIFDSAMSTAMLRLPTLAATVVQRQFPSSLSPRREFPPTRRTNLSTMNSISMEGQI